MSKRQINSTFTKQELKFIILEFGQEQLSRVLSLQYSIPLRNKFNLSKSQARELIEVIHGIVTRKILKDN